MNLTFSIEYGLDCCDTLLVDIGLHYNGIRSSYSAQKNVTESVMNKVLDCSCFLIIHTF